MTVSRVKPVILVADDDNDFRNVVAKKLTNEGFSVIQAHDGEEAVKSAKESKPDLILMDIRMPKLSGIDAAIQIKDDPEASAAKIVFLSGLDDPFPALTGDKSKVSKAFGMEDFIPKTEELPKIAEKVKAFLAPVPEPK